MSDEEIEDEAPQKKKGVLSDKTKGIIVGAAGALALAGVIYAIMQEDKPKPHAPKPVEHHPRIEDVPLDQDLFAEIDSPDIQEAEVDVTETPTSEGGVKITSVLKDMSTVGAAARGLSALEPVAEMLIAFL
jgi:hypothetical protein